MTVFMRMFYWGVIKMITVKNLNKNFKTKMKLNNKSVKTTVKAVNDISFEIADGEIVGFVGPNRSRKIYNNKNDYRNTSPNIW